MYKKLLATAFILSLIPALSGCLALVAGAGGTALWQAGKIITEEPVSMETAVKAVESAFKAEKISLEEKVTKTAVTQLRGTDAANTKVAVDVFSKGARDVRIEVRYGLGEENPARDLLKAIKRRL